MKYLLALAACFGIFVVYAIIAGVMGWKHGGGAIPMLILFAAIVGTWRTITKKSDQSNDQYSSPIKMQTGNKDNDDIVHDTSANESYWSVLNSESNIIPKTNHVDPIDVHAQVIDSQNEASMNCNDNTMVINEDELFLQATQEVDEGNQDQALWAKCMALCEGDENKAKYKYIKERVERFILAEKARIEREQIIANNLKENDLKFQYEKFIKKIKYYVENKELLIDALRKNGFDYEKVQGAMVITDNKGGIHAFVKDEDLIQYLCTLFSDLKL